MPAFHFSLAERLPEPIVRFNQDENAARAERAAAEAVQLARQRYRDGIDDNLSVLDAERTLLNLKDQLASARTLAASRLVAVYKAFSAGQGARR